MYRERIICLDYGSKNIGIAVSDPFGWIAQGLSTLKREGIEKDFASLKKILEEYDVKTVLLGLPLNMDGSRGMAAQAVTDFGEDLKARLGIQIVYWDERLSTVAVQKMLISNNTSRSRRREVIDKLAAVFILQGYLDRKNQTIAP